MTKKTIIRGKVPKNETVVGDLSPKQVTNLRERMNKAGVKGRLMNKTSVKAVNDKIRQSRNKK